MDVTLTIALIAATALLVAIPGPNVALVVANTVGYGFSSGAATVLGTTVGVALQLSIVVLGLVTVLELAASVFVWLKWIGVGYLIYLGVKAWRQGVEDMDEQVPCKKPLKVLFWQGVLLATINPKTMIFSAAFLPQFVKPGSGPEALLLAAAIYLCVIFVGDLIWAATAHSVRPIILKLGRLRHRLTGLLFVGSGIGLGLARVDR